MSKIPAELLEPMTADALAHPALPGSSYLEQYCCAVLSGKIVACLRIRQLLAQLLDKLRNPEKYDPYVFDEEEANRHIDFVESFCRQAQGRLGTPIQLELFQRARWQAIFGFVHKDTRLRQYNEVLIIEGRKNGKTTEVAALELDMLTNDREGAPEIYNIATTRDQAGKAYTACVQMRQQNPDLWVIRKRQGDLYFPLNMGFIKVLATNSNSLDGLNAHMIVIDELHAIKKRSVYDDMKQSQSFRDQPLLFCITTNGFVRLSIFDDQYKYACRILDGTVVDEHFLAFIYELDDREEWHDEHMWIKANPGLGTIKKLSFLRQMCQKAAGDPSFLPTVLVKDFNMKENSSTAWLQWVHINNEETFDLKFKYCIGGMDAADSVDLNAATVLCMRPDDDKIYRRSMYWIPQDVLDRAAVNWTGRERDNVPYETWVKNGLLRTVPGNKVDKIVFLEWFKELQATEGLRVLYIGYDPWHIDDSLLRAFKGEFGEAAMIPVRQGVYTLSNPMKDLKADLGAQLVVDSNHPIDKWCMINIEVKTDTNGNIQPVKGLDSRQRIDGTMALIDGYVVLQNNKDELQSMNKGVK